MIEIYNNAFKRLLGEKISVSSIADCRRLIRSAVISEFLLHYPQKTVAFKLNTSAPNVSAFSKDVSDMREENRSTNWVFRAALYDMMDREFTHLSTAEITFCRLVCENMIEDKDFNISDAVKELNSSVVTLKKYAKEFIKVNEDKIKESSLSSAKRVKKKVRKKPKKKWWEA